MKFSRKGSHVVRRQPARDGVRKLGTQTTANEIGEVPLLRESRSCHSFVKGGWQPRCQTKFAVPAPLKQNWEGQLGQLLAPGAVLLPPAFFPSPTHGCLWVQSPPALLLGSSRLPAAMLSWCSGRQRVRAEEGLCKTAEMTPLAGVRAGAQDPTHPPFQARHTVPSSSFSKQGN